MHISKFVYLVSCCWFILFFLDYLKNWKVVNSENNVTKCSKLVVTNKCYN